MKVKIINNLEYQTYPIVDGMVEVDESTLQQIGSTLQFKGTDGSVEHYTKPTFKIGYEQLVESKIRERYTLSQELAILRQRDTKQSEYQEYFNYCEQCKTEAKNEVGV